MPRDGIGREIYSKQQQPKKHQQNTKWEFEIKAHNRENNKYEKENIASAKFKGSSMEIGENCVL